MEDSLFSVVSELAAQLLLSSVIAVGFNRGHRRACGVTEVSQILAVQSQTEPGVLMPVEGRVNNIN